MPMFSPESRQVHVCPAESLFALRLWLSCGYMSAAGVSAGSPAHLAAMAAACWERSAQHSSTAARQRGLSTGRKTTSFGHTVVIHDSDYCSSFLRRQWSVLQGKQRLMADWVFFRGENMLTLAYPLKLLQVWCYVGGGNVNSHHPHECWLASYSTCTKRYSAPVNQLSNLF